MVGRKCQIEFMLTSPKFGMDFDSQQRFYHIFLMTRQGLTSEKGTCSAGLVGADRRFNIVKNIGIQSIYPPWLGSTCHVRFRHSICRQARGEDGRRFGVHPADDETDRFEIVRLGAGGGQGLWGDEIVGGQSRALARGRQ